MDEVRKRRPLWFYLLLPLSVALLSILAAGLFARQRAKLIAPLVDAVAGGDTSQAIAALRQLSRMPAPPFDILVSAAASRDPQIAAAAQSALDDVLQSIQTRIRNNGRLSAVADQLAVLAKTLADKQKLFPADDQAWVGATTHEVLRLANQIPNSEAPNLAATCDAILAGVASTGPSPAARHRPAPFEPSLSARGMNLLPPDGGDESTSRMEATLFPPNERGARPPSPLFGAGPVVGAPPKMPDQPAGPPLASTDETSHRSSNSPTLLWRPQWGNSPPITAASPQMKIVGVRPVESAAVPHSPRPSIAPVPANADLAALADVPPKELLKQWLVANKSDAIAIEVELATRGFGRISRQLVERYFSSDSADRLRLVDDLLNAPDVGARPWMLLLADDSSADVRLAVITIMATSNDRVLLDKAFQVAIRDRDPRIANMAARLNERRSAAGLRQLCYTNPQRKQGNPWLPTRVHAHRQPTKRIAMFITRNKFCQFGTTDLSVPPIVFGAGPLGNACRIIPDQTKLAIVSEWFKQVATPVVIEVSGRPGAGLALQMLGVALRRLDIKPKELVLSCRLGWLRSPAPGDEHPFVPGNRSFTESSTTLQISYPGILACWEQTCRLLGQPYAPQLAAIADIDEFLGAAASAAERDARIRDLAGAYRALHELKAAGQVRAVGVWAKDWRVAQAIAATTPLDWVTLDGSLTVFRHPPELLAFVANLQERQIPIVVAGPFQSGFLVGGNYLDGRILDRHNDADRPHFAWRTSFAALCEGHGVTPAHACLQFALRVPGVAAVLSNTSHPDRVAENAYFAAEGVPDALWASMKREGLLGADISQF